jgi:phage recombination protein Bet
MTTALVEQKAGVIAEMASSYGMNPQAFEQTMLQTVMPSNVKVTKEQVAAFLLVAREHHLNPFTKEIYAFPAKGGIQPVVSIDGWVKLINTHPQFNGMEFVDGKDAQGHIDAITCKLFRKDREHPTEVTEYMIECRRDTEPWRKWPARMLRHKAMIQAARYAFGFAGIVDPDEAERIDSVKATNVQVSRAAIAAVSEAPELSQEDTDRRDQIIDALRTAANIGRAEFAETFAAMDEGDRALVGMTEIARIKEDLRD